MRYGHFDDDRREYVITRPDTPLPWINYLGSEDYFGIISNTAGGYSFYRDARLRRLTRYRYNNAPLDVGGRYLYLRDDDERRRSGRPSWQPTQRDARRLRVPPRPGLHDDRARGAPGIRAETRYFVPLGETLEIWRARVTNERPEPARLSLFGAVEFCLWDAQDDATNFQRNYSIGEVEVEDGVIYHTTEYRERRNHFAYFACSEPLGRLRHVARRLPRPVPRLGPAARRRARRDVRTRSPTAGSRSARTRSRLELAPGETREVIFVLGYAENPRRREVRPAGLRGRSTSARVRPVIDRYLDPAAVEDALRRRCGDRWDELLGVVPGRDRQRAPRPDGQHLERLPVHGHVQPVALGVARSSPGSAAAWASATRTRTCSGFVHMVPERARERILDIAATQLPTGGAYHQYQPLTKRGNDAVGSGFNDDPLWLVLAVAAYVKETGDLRDPRRAGPVRQRAGQRAAARRAPPAGDRLHARPPRAARAAAHRPGRLERLPQPQLLLRRRPGESFQTTQNREGGVAESVFIAGLFVLAADELAAIAEHRGDPAEAERLRARRASGWSRRSTRTAGTASGSGAPTTSSASRSARPRTTRARSSSSRRACASWPASASTTAGRSGRSTSVRERLATPHGIVLQQPAFTALPPPSSARSRRTRPATRRTPAIFCHTNPWIMIAEALAGNGERRPRLLPADQPVGPRGDLRDPPLRAVRLRPDDRRPGRADPRRGEELVADRDGRLELRRGDPVDPRHPARSSTACGSTRACRPTGARSG